MLFSVMILAVLYALVQCICFLYFFKDYRSADRDTLQTVGGKNHVWRDHWPKGKVVPSPPTREDRQENKTTKIPGRRKGEPSSSEKRPKEKTTTMAALEKSAAQKKTRPSFRSRKMRAENIGQTDVVHPPKKILAKKDTGSRSTKSAAKGALMFSTPKLITKREAKSEDSFDSASGVSL